MNTPVRAFSPQIAVLVGFVLAAALARLLPHAWNFTPVEAVALFGGAYFSQRWAAFLIPLGALLLSDLWLGFYNLMPVVYACIALSVLIGTVLRGRIGLLSVSVAGLGSVLLFFVVTNFAVWWFADPLISHPACKIGLTECYVAALPFLKSQLIGTAVWSLLLFGGFEWLQRQVPALRQTQTA